VETTARVGGGCQCSLIGSSMLSVIIGMVTTNTLKTPYKQETPYVLSTA